MINHSYYTKNAPEVKRRPRRLNPETRGEAGLCCTSARIAYTERKSNWAASTAANTMTGHELWEVGFDE
jgi:hypothetical protein